MISIIVARTPEGVIGYQGDMPWGRGLKVDLRRFRDLTTGNAVIMGRKTFESIGRALPGRQNIVVTSRPLAIDGVQAAGSFGDALELVEPGRKSFVIGGARLYEEALGLADVVYETLVRGQFVGDVYFPALPEGDWELTSSENVEAGSDCSYPISWRNWARKEAR